MASTLTTSQKISPPPVNPGSAQDVENVDLSSTDYVPNGGYAAGFYILGTTGTVKIDTPQGTTITIPTGLSAGVRHMIAFTKMYKTGTSATSILAWVP